MKRKRDRQNLQKIYAQLLEKREKLREEREKLPPPPTPEEPPQNAIHIPGTNVYLKLLDISMVNVKKEGQRIGIFGNTGSGKSIIALAIMYANRHIGAWQIHSESESRNHQYGKHLRSEVTIFNELNPDGLYNAKKRQEKVCKKWEVEGTDPVEYRHDPSMGLIIDDVAKDEEIIRKDPIFSYIHCVSRHDKLLFIELFQYYSQLIPKYRRQLSWVFMMRPVSESDIVHLHKEFFAAFTFSTFKKIVYHVTNDHGALVINILSQADNIMDRVFYYKAPFPVPKFICGTRIQQKYYNHIYNPNWEDEVPDNIESEIAKLESEIREEELILKKKTKKSKTIE